ncbi:MAG: hypothetical protein CVU71_09170 [Deltaproteobacteria bacterium HGW-Deltaproteobacteria-6]|jgi:hypothetical protein|nr:MAG: hypothetical protein CVU71_09170 [Deltaproteobacteria bacterium HGW-Deltaproteobacteria-6]
MKIIRSTCILLCLSFVLVSCSALAPLKHPGPCLPDFPYQDGWYGADSAYSIALDNQRTLWLFGDTFVSEDKTRKDRIGMDVVLGTTLAVSTCSENAAFKIRYHLKKKNGKFVSSFGENEWLWPQDPFIAQGVLYIPLLVIQGLPDAQPPFNFKIAGLRIARIKDFQAVDPHLWPVDYLDWTRAIAAGVEALATTSVFHENYLYVYPLYRHKEGNTLISGNILARIAIDHLDKPENYLEYWTGRGWQKELKSTEVKIIFPGVSELSVRYHAEDGQWLAVYLSPENKGHQLLYQTAPSPEGPWNRPAALIKTIAEVDPASPLYHPQTFCYAGKEHRQFTNSRNLVVTYVCNSSEDMGSQESFLRKNLFLYRPQVKNIQR